MRRSSHNLWLSVPLSLCPQILGSLEFACSLFQESSDGPTGGRQRSTAGLLHLCAYFTKQQVRYGCPTLSKFAVVTLVGWAQNHFKTDFACLLAAGLRCLGFIHYNWYLEGT